MISQVLLSESHGHYSIMCDFPSCLGFSMIGSSRKLGMYLLANTKCPMPNPLAQIRIISAMSLTFLNLEEFIVKSI